MALKSLLGGVLAVLLTVFVVFNVVMPAMTVVAIMLAGLIRAIPPSLTIPVVALLAVIGIVYFFKRR